MNYPVTAALAVGASVGYDILLARTRLVTRKAFWTAYGIVLVFQLVVNGVLTGLRVVRYDRAHIIGWRIAYAPVEDLAFGFAMVLVTLTSWVWLGRRQPDRAPRAAPSAGRSAPPERGAGYRR